MVKETNKEGKYPQKRKRNPKAIENSFKTFDEEFGYNPSEKIDHNPEKEERVEEVDESEELEIKKPEDRKKEEEIEKIHKEIEEVEKNKEQQEQNEKEEEIIAHAMKNIGLSEEDLQKDENWKDLTNGQKLLVIEQISQDTLSRIREIGEQRFHEKNKINLKSDIGSGAIFKKVWKNFTKAYQINQEEKNVLNELQKNKLTPDIKKVKEIVEVTADMGLNVIEKNGKAHIILEKIYDEMNPEDKEVIEKYNETANKFMRMPLAWINEKAAKGADGNFINKNYETYQKAKEEYEKSRGEILKIKAKKYQELNPKNKPEESETYAKLDLNDNDFNIDTLQILNTNPDITEELKKIKSESSFKQYFKDNENIWKAIYLGSGFAMRSATKATLGAIAMPLVSGIFGGIKARRKAQEKINKAHLEGMSGKTFMERKQEDGSREESIDKNTGKGKLSKLLSGSEINAKEVAGFIDADSQIQRIEKLLSDLNKENFVPQRNRIISQINARVDYIIRKKEEGLINYGKENAIGLSYKLMQKISEVSVMCEIKKMTEETDENGVRRQSLLNKIIQHNEEKFGKRETSYKRWQIIRGAGVAATFSFAGWLIRHLQDGATVEDLINAEEAKTSLSEIQKMHDGINNETFDKLPSESEIDANSSGVSNTAFDSLPDDSIDTDEAKLNAELDSMLIKDETISNTLPKDTVLTDEIIPSDSKLKLNILNKEFSLTKKGFSLRNSLPHQEIKLNQNDLMSAHENLSSLGSNIENHGSVEISATHGDGGIFLARKMRDQLIQKYGEDWANNPKIPVPDGTKEILGMKDYELAEKWGLYKPGQDAESAVVKVGDQIKFDEETGKAMIFNKESMQGADLNENYTGKMFDYHPKIKVEIPNEEIPRQDNFIPVEDYVGPEYEQTPDGTEIINDVEHVKFSDPNNPVLDLQENGAKYGDIKFSYDENHNVNGAQMTGSLEVGNEAEKYLRKLKIDDFSTDQQKEIKKDISGLISRRKVLKGINPNTQEHRFFEQKMIKKENEVIEKWDRVLKNRKLESDLEEIDGDQRRELKGSIGGERHELTTEEALKIKTVSARNINSIFKTEGQMKTWIYVRKGPVKDLINLSGEEEGFNKNLKPLLSYVNKLRKVTGLEPMEAGSNVPPESINDYVNRVVKKAAENGKLNKIKLYK